MCKASGQIPRSYTKHVKLYSDGFPAERTLTSAFMVPRARLRDRDRQTETDRQTDRQTENSNWKTLILKDSGDRSIWTYLTASPCHTTNTNKHDNTTNRYYKHE